MRAATGWKRHLYVAFTGLAVGAADVVPGVSGGTMAFVMGVYEELVDALKSFDGRMARRLARLRVAEALAPVPWPFLTVLGGGMAAAVLTLAEPIGWLLDHRPAPLFGFFFGLVLASIVTVGAQVRWSPAPALCLLLGSGGSYLLVGLVPLAMPHDAPTLFLSGAAAITAMILPGVSGSFVLLVLGQYEFVIDAVRHRDFLALAPLALGCAAGILAFVRVLSWLLRRRRETTIALLIGFMVGSLRRIWPFKADPADPGASLGQVNVLPDPDPAFWLALSLCLLGFLLVYALSRLEPGR